MARNTEISNSDNVIDSRDVIERIEELQSERDGLQETVSEITALASEEHGAANLGAVQSALAVWDADNGDELNALKALHSEAEGYCEDWRHGEPLIRDSYFAEYARELCDDTDSGALKELPDYLKNNIDWDGVATDLQVDYTSVEFDGVTYWVR